MQMNNFFFFQVLRFCTQVISTFVSYQSFFVQKCFLTFSCCNLIIGKTVNLEQKFWQSSITLGLF